MLELFRGRESCQETHGRECRAPREIILIEVTPHRPRILFAVNAQPTAAADFCWVWDVRSRMSVRADAWLAIC
jgi:hypothetical protein